MENITLNTGQQEAFELMQSGANTLLCGKAGTGKSYVVERFIHYLLEETDKQVLVCAPTGIAALNLSEALSSVIKSQASGKPFSATTIHNAFDLAPLNIFNPHERYAASSVLKHADVIVVDEISMCRCDLFDAMMSCLADARNKTKHPVQLILCGDVLQLPPVKPSRTNRQGRANSRLLASYYPHSKDFFFFDAHRWDISQYHVHFLDEIVRQDTGDKNFFENLNLLREGNKACIEYFNKYVQLHEQQSYYDSSGVMLEGKKLQVSRVNHAALQQLSKETPVRFYQQSGQKVVQHSTDDQRFDSVLELKKGARVMALINDSQGRYANGSLGTVVDISVEQQTVRVRFDTTTKNNEPVEVGRYTWKEHKPIVKQVSKGGFSYQEVSAFSQIPLRLAYAMTIHKAQGQTFNRVIVNPRSFEHGQLYVALSRCRSVNDIVLTQEIQPEDIRIAGSAVEWERTAREVAAIQRVKLSSDKTLTPSSTLEIFIKTASVQQYESYLRLLDTTLHNSHPLLTPAIKTGRDNHLYLVYKESGKTPLFTIRITEHGLSVSFAKRPSHAADPYALCFKKTGRRYAIDIEEPRALEKAEYAARVIRSFK